MSRVTRPSNSPLPTKSRSAGRAPVVAESKTSCSLPGNGHFVLAGCHLNPANVSAVRAAACTRTDKSCWRAGCIGKVETRGTAWPCAYAPSTFGVEPQSTTWHYTRSRRSRFGSLLASPYSTQHDLVRRNAKWALRRPRQEKGVWPRGCGH